MVTRVRVAARPDGWEVRVDGLPVGQYRLKREAISDAREAAREHAPSSRVDVQSRFTGAWKTLVTW